MMRFFYVDMYTINSQQNALIFKHSIGFEYKIGSSLHFQEIKFENH